MKIFVFLRKPDVPGFWPAIGDVDRVDRVADDDMVKRVGSRWTGEMGWAAAAGAATK